MKKNKVLYLFCLWKRSFFLILFLLVALCLFDILAAEGIDFSGGIGINVVVTDSGNNTNSTENNTNIDNEEDNVISNSDNLNSHNSNNINNRQINNGRDKAEENIIGTENFILGSIKLNENSTLNSKTKSKNLVLTLLLINSVLLFVLMISLLVVNEKSKSLINE
jgi:preprotein translocase subunit SecF